MDSKAKKKSLTGWTYCAWEKEFGYLGEATFVNRLKIISIPEIYRVRGFIKNWTPESGKPRKVRITIEELQPTEH